jgi:uncharacterized protein (DUF2141 family)
MFSRLVRFELCAMFAANPIEALFMKNPARTWLLGSFLIFAANIPFVAHAEDFNIQLTVTGVEVDKGQIIAAIFDSPDSWMKTSAEQLIGPPLADDTVVLVFKNYPAGEYGIAVVYDKNKDGKLDTGLFDIPTEKVAFSNDAPIRFGPAKWDKAKFAVTDADVALAVHLKAQSKQDYSEKSE